MANTRLANRPEAAIQLGEELLEVNLSTVEKIRKNAEEIGDFVLLQKAREAHQLITSHKEGLKLLTDHLSVKKSTDEALSKATALYVFIQNRSQGITKYRDLAGQQLFEIEKDFDKIKIQLKALEADPDYQELRTKMQQAYEDLEFRSIIKNESDFAVFQQKATHFRDGLQSVNTHLQELQVQELQANQELSSQAMTTKEEQPQEAATKTVQPITSSARNEQGSLPAGQTPTPELSASQKYDFSIEKTNTQKILDAKTSNIERIIDIMKYLDQHENEFKERKSGFHHFFHRNQVTKPIQDLQKVLQPLRNEYKIHNGGRTWEDYLQQTRSATAVYGLMVRINDIGKNTHTKNAAAKTLFESIKTHMENLLPTTRSQNRK